MNRRFITYLLLLLGLSLGLSACRPDRLADELCGTWALESINDEGVGVNHLEILEFHPDGQLTVAKMYGPSHHFRKRWIESKGNHYRLNGRRLMMDGRLGNGLSFVKNTHIQHIDSLHLQQRVGKHLIGQIDQIFTKGRYRQVYHKLNTDYPQPVGKWELMELNGRRFGGLRFHLKSDGSFDCFIENNGRWDLKRDNDGRWYSYGNILCINYFNDILREELSYENVSYCFRYEISDDIITWISNDNEFSSFVLVKYED